MERLFGGGSGEPTSTWAQPAPFSLGICLEGGTVSPGLSLVTGLSVCPSSLTWFLCDRPPSPAPLPSQEDPRVLPHTPSLSHRVL